MGGPRLDLRFRATCTRIEPGGNGPCSSRCDLRGTCGSLSKLSAMGPPFPRFTEPQPRQIVWMNYFGNLLRQQCRLPGQWPVKAPQHREVWIRTRNCELVFDSVDLANGDARRAFLQKATARSANVAVITEGRGVRSGRYSADVLPPRLGPQPGLRCRLSLRRPSPGRHRARRQHGGLDAHGHPPTPTSAPESRTSSGTPNDRP